MTDHERYHRARRDTGLVVIEGFHALKHAIRFGARLEDIVTDDIEHLHALTQRLAPDIAATLRASAVVRLVSPAVLAALTPAPHPTRVLALAARPLIPMDVLYDAGRAPVIVLDDPRHAGNIGAAVRVAAAAGADGLFVTGDADPWQPAAVRGGAGLQFALPVAIVARDALASTARIVVAVDPDGDEMSSSDLPTDPVFLFGSERDGLSAEMLARADRRIRIPMRDGVSSLNLATAVAVMLYK